MEQQDASTDFVKRKFERISPYLDEQTRRIWAATEADALGHGGIEAVSKATGIARSTIGRGIEELEGRSAPAETGRVRRAGGGRKPAAEAQPGLEAALTALVEPSVRGDPDSPLLWVSKSCRSLAAELARQGFKASHTLVAKMLKGLGFTLQANVKTKEGGSHPDRDAQFEHISRQVASFLADGQPVISVDTKKKENVGGFKNGGRTWRPKGTPEEVKVHDFMDKELGKASPYGIYDVANNIGWVNVGISHDTGAFAVESIRRWWHHLGRDLFPDAARLLITADGGGSNGARVRLWKTELQELARETGIDIQVCHLPPGTSKWNRIEHRLFSFISMNWRGRPLRDVATIISLIAATTTEAGLKVYCTLDETCYEKGIKVAQEEMDALDIRRDDFHGEWNYTLLARPEADNDAVVS